MKNIPLILATSTILTAPSLAQNNSTVKLEPIIVSTDKAAIPSPSKSSNLLPEAPGGQVATGGRLGVLGNRNFMSAPFNITAYTSKLIAYNQARTVADVAANDPSVRAIFPRSSYRDVFTIRGFNLFSYNMGFDGLYGIAPKQRYPAEFAERIEILKGPDTFVNGISLGGSVGGAINIVPKRAGDEPVTSITTSYSSDSVFGTHLDFGRRYGSNNEFGVRFNGLLRGGNPPIDDQSERLGAASVSLDYKGEGVRIYGDFGLQRQKFDAQDWAVTVAPRVSDIPVPDSTVSLSQPWAYMVSRDAYGVVRAEYDLSDNWMVFGAFGISDTESTGFVVRPTNLQSNGDYVGSIMTFPSGGVHYSGQAGLRGWFDTGMIEHNITLALTRWNQDLKATGGPLKSFNSNIFNPVKIAAPNRSSLVDLDDIYRTNEHRYTSFAIADTLSVSDDRLLLTIGGRWQNIEIDNFAATTGVLTSSYDEAKFSPAVGVVVKPIENVSFYSNYVEALQQGPTAPVGSVNYGEIFAPIVSRQIEIGVKADLGNWTTSISAFRITQPSGLLDLRTNVFAIDGKQRNQGIELNAAGEPIDGFRLLGGIAWIDGRQLQTANGTFDNKKAIGVPEYQLNLAAELDVPRVDGLTVSGRVITTGRQFVNAANTQSIDSWTRFDVGARYVYERENKKDIILRAAVENVLGRDYWASASTGQVTGISRGAPRTFLVSTTFEF